MNLWVRPCFFCPWPYIIYLDVSSSFGGDSKDKISIIRLTRLSCVNRPTDSQRLLYHFHILCCRRGIINKHWIWKQWEWERPPMRAFFAREWCDKIRSRQSQRRRRASFRDERRAKRGKNAPLSRYLHHESLNWMIEKEGAAPFPP